MKLISSKQYWHTFSFLLRQANSLYITTNFCEEKIARKTYNVEQIKHNRKLFVIPWISIRSFQIRLFLGALRTNCLNWRRETFNCTTLNTLQISINCQRNCGAPSVGDWNKNLVLSNEFAVMNSRANARNVSFPNIQPLSTRLIKPNFCFN